MQFKNRIYNYILFLIKCLLIETNPILYELINRNNETVKRLQVRENTSLAIIGFPRCGNTFAVYTFLYAHPKVRKIAHHVHVPAQVKKAVKLSIPTIILIRNPMEAISSLIVRHPEISIKNALISYIVFYRSIISYSNGFVIAEFNEIISNFSLIIKKVNGKFGTNFIPITPKGKVLNNIYNKIAEANKIDSGGMSTHLAMPSPLRSEINKKIKNKIRSCNYRKLKNMTFEVYQKYLNIR
jgi:hypothetical protein